MCKCEEIVLLAPFVCTALAKRMDEGWECSYFVLMESEENKGDRWLRLGDLAAHEVIVVRCPCGRSVEYHKGFLQRRYRVPSDTLVFDLQFRLRCKGCNGWRGFRVTILMSGRAGIIRRQGWNGWWWRGSEKSAYKCNCLLNLNQKLRRF